MLSHLRFHRRGPSNPSSPAVEQPSPSSLQSHQQSPLNPDAASPLDAQQPSPASASASLPPTLPPIARVTSSDLDLDPLGLGDKRDVDKQPQTQPQPQPQPVSQPAQPQRPGYSSGSSSFIGGVALRNYQRNAQAKQVDGHGQTSPKKADSPSRPSPRTSSPTKGIASLSINNLAGSSSSNQRHSGSRLAGESLPSSAVLNIEPLKGKKGLPFLKNPMSTLLLRRKNNQSLSNDLPLPLGSRLDEPTYDPRIKGTRVHDFSAPRRRTNAPATDTVAIRSASLANIALESGVGPHDGAESRGPAALDGQLQRRMMSSASDPARPESGSTNSHTIAQSSSVSSVRTGSSTAEQAFPLEDNVLRGLTMKSNDSALKSTPSAASQATAQDLANPARDTGSMRTTRSRNVSLSSIPRHMKSTSSRFSFDMIGAAKQEKLLEERHRQRELDKKAAEGEPRDSRFDDFDEDSFDYDAMMEDDGFEETIPEINADYDEEEIPYLDDDRYDEQEAQYVGDDVDPDDDQENFAGFTFQRSNATSSLTSPQSLGMFPTPRDADGEAIGCAMAKDSPGLSLPPLPPAPPGQGADAEVSGLGIHGVDAVSDSLQTLNLEASSVPPATDVSPPVRRKMSYDDLYFDEGMAGFGGVFAEDLAGGPVDDGVPFDESLFDNDDTDKYGRPFAGAFAAAKLAREEKSKQKAVQEETEEEEPILESQQSSERQDLAQAETQVSTSISPDQPDGSDDDQAPNNLPPLSETTIVAPQPTAYSANPIAAYQAALAAAAQKAAASGEFERSLAQSPTDADNIGPAAARFDESDGLPHYAYDDYGYSYDDMDDFEMDDDAIIAEANASALANDYDGWYGQEFGFYAAPINNHGSHNASSGSEDNAYIAGGFFGPKGANNINRSISGRVVSREPNLTPITERSEYSNRNSLMSLGMPPISGTPVVQSPGLAQLAMMADRGDEQMNLSALLRLRSKAWGGSQASLASSKDGSPRSERGDAPGSPRGPGFPAGFPSSIGHTRKNSAFSVVSRDSEPGSAPASPTLTMPTSALAFSSSAQPDFVNRDADVASAWAAVSASPVQQMGSNLLQEGISPLSDARYPPAFAAPGAHPHAMSSSQSATTTSPGKGHQRQKGSTDSISYMMEEESGEKRWILERRRTGEFGEVEILEREVVEGGRI